MLIIIFGDARLKGVGNFILKFFDESQMVFLSDVVYVVLPVLAVFVNLGLVGGSAAEDARGAQGEAVNRLGPHDDYLGATIFRVPIVSSSVVGLGLSRTSWVMMG